MRSRIVRNALMISLACWTLASHAAPATPQAVRSAPQLDAALSSSRATPLDALTPYGKRRFVESLRWTTQGVAGFDSAILVRELDSRQLAAVLAFIGAEAALPALSKDLVGAPIRLRAPTEDVVARLRAIERLAAEGDAEPYRLASRYMDLFGRLGPIKVRELPPADLPLYFDAAVLAAREEAGTQGQVPLYSAGDTALRNLLLIHGELKAYGYDTRRSFDAAVLRTLMQAGRLEQAREFMRDKPHLRDLPVPAPKEPFGSGVIGHDGDRLAGF